jgi:hypothetical protein
MAAPKKVLATLMRRAYRRPVTEADFRVPLKLYKEARRDGGFEEGIEMALRAVLISPEFIFRVEQDPAGVAPNTAYRLTDVELASRLSFFLWSSIPDDELLDTAISGKLRSPTVLEKQVRRMLADPRSRVLATNFAEQWLYLRNLASASPDMRLFPDFDDNLRQSFRQETELFFESIMREDRNVLDLLRANYVSQSAPRQTLRDSKCIRQPFPTGYLRRRRTGRASAPGEFFDGDVLCHPYLAGDPRQVDSR